jgi:Ca2+/Na+ antiporter
MSDGAELLMLVPSIEKVVSSVVLPVLGAVPDGCMVLVSGLGAREVVNHEVKAGVGALAGSTIMLLTLPWFVSVFIGRVDLIDGVPAYKGSAKAKAPHEKLTKGFSLLGTGVALGPEIPLNAKLMLQTSGGYLIMQVPAIIWPGKGTRWLALAGFIVCLAGLAYYCYKMFAGATETNNNEKVVEIMTEAIKSNKMSLRNAMVTIHDWIKDSDEGGEISSMSTPLSEPFLKPSDPATLTAFRRMCKLLKPFFQHYDTNGDDSIDFTEFCMVAKDMRLGYSTEDLATYFAGVERNQSDRADLQFDEFCAFVIQVSLERKNGAALVCDSSMDITGAPKRASLGISDRQTSDDSALRFPDRRRSNLGMDKVYTDMVSKEIEEEDGSGLSDSEDSGEEEEDMPDDLKELDPEEQQRSIKLRALYLTGIGTLLVLVFSDPTIDLFTELGNRLDISPFYVAFLLAPIASNASELVAAKQMAAKRTAKSQENALKVLEGAGCMNNTFCLACLLVLVWIRDLPWNFSAECLSILAIEIIIFVLVSIRKVQTLLEGFIMLSLFPLSIAIVWLMENKLDMD